MVIPVFLFPQGFDYSTLKELSKLVNTSTPIEGVKFQPVRSWLLPFFLGLLIPSVARAYPQGEDALSSVPSAQAQFERGKQLFERGEYAQAAAEFSSLLKTYPASPLLYNLLGVCNQQEGRSAEAITNLKKAIELESNFKAAHYNLGGVYLAQGKPQEAANEFLTTVRIDPKDPQAYYHLARAEVAAQQKESALQHLEQAYALSPSSLPIVMALAEAYHESGRRAAGQPLAERLAAVSSPDSQVELELGRVLLNYDLEDAAARHFQNALARSAGVRDTLQTLARVCFRDQNYRAAVAILKAIGPPSPDSPSWHERLGESYFKLGDPKQAVSELQKALDLDPQNENYILELAEVFVTHGTPEAAVVLLEADRKSFPRSSRIWFGLGLANLAGGHYPSAERALRTSLDLDPKFDLGYEVLAQCYLQADEWPQLRQTSDRLVELNPGNPKGYYYKALALLRNPGTSNPDEQAVENLLRRAIQLGPELPEPRNELAKLLARRGDKEASIRELEGIVRTHPDFGPAHYQLYRLYLEKGAKARSELERKEYEKIHLSEDEFAMRRLLVEIHEGGRGSTLRKEN
jgi:tetratricopeptide (TPR) repeat protein